MSVSLAASSTSLSYSAFFKRVRLLIEELEYNTARVKLFASESASRLLTTFGHVGNERLTIHSVGESAAHVDIIERRLSMVKPIIFGAEQRASVDFLAHLGIGHDAIHLGTRHADHINGANLIIGK